MLSKLLRSPTCYSCRGTWNDYTFPPPGARSNRLKRVGEKIDRACNNPRRKENWGATPMTGRKLLI